jgi:hypothetical protein
VDSRVTPLHIVDDKSGSPQARTQHANDYRRLPLEPSTNGFPQSEVRLRSEHLERAPVAHANCRCRDARLQKRGLANTRLADDDARAMPVDRRDHSSDFVVAPKKPIKRRHQA